MVNPLNGYVMIQPEIKQSALIEDDVTALIECSKGVVKRTGYGLGQVQVISIGDTVYFKNINTHQIGDLLAVPYINLVAKE
jgi:hypothetical protein